MQNDNACTSVECHNEGTLFSGLGYTSSLPTQQHVLVKVAYCAVSKMHAELIWKGEWKFPREKTILGSSVSGKTSKVVIIVSGH